MKNLLNSNNPGHCYIIAEAGLNHNGSIEIAKRLIDVAAVAGVDAVKFQKRTISQLAVQSVLDAKDERFPEFGKTYREIREHLEFDFDEYRELKAYAEAKNLDFLCTAFDIEAVDFLERLGVKGYKLASHSLTNSGLLDYLAKLKKPTIMSTGMAEIEEIDHAVNIFRKHDAPLILMHCVSAYPTPLVDCNLSAMNKLKTRYNLPVGYSGHEIGFLPTLTAVAMGAQLVERHYTLRKDLPGFDHKLSLAPDELIAMTRDIRDIEKIKGNAEKKVSETEWITRRKYHVSMVSATAIKKGAVISEEYITWKNPGTGIPTSKADLVIGKRAVKDIPADELLALDMFE